MSSLILGVFLQNVGGLGFIVVGTQALEVGTLLYNLSTLSEGKNRFLRYGYWAAISISNAIASGLGFWYMSNSKMPMYSRIFYLITSVGLSIGRQREAILDMQAAAKEWRKTPIRK